MALFNKIPEYFFDGTTVRSYPQQQVYIDDIFDPLFNAQVREYLEAKYGSNPIFNTLAGYGEGIKNALVGNTDQWGILGPGMGILSSFGRSMDKAGDFIIGGITEGVNAVGNMFGSNIPVENPIENIFVNDQDYSGKRLMAAMANSMNQLAGGTTLDESDFTGLGYNVAGIGLDFATDPSILGGALANKFAPEVAQAYKAGKISADDILQNLGKAGNRSAVGELGQLFVAYDDLMAKVSIDLTAPGLRPFLNKMKHKIKDLVGASDSADHIDQKLNAQRESDTVDQDYTRTDFNTHSQYNNADFNAEQFSFEEPLPPEVIKQDELTESYLNTMEDMLHNIIAKYDISPITDPEAFKLVAESLEMLDARRLTYSKHNRKKYSSRVYLTPADTDEVVKAEQKYTEALTEYKNKTSAELNKVFGSRPVYDPATHDVISYGYGGRLASDLNNSSNNLIQNLIPSEKEEIEIMRQYFSDSADPEDLLDIFGTDNLEEVPYENLREAYYEDGGDIISAAVDNDPNGALGQIITLAEEYEVPESSAFTGWQNFLEDLEMGSIEEYFQNNHPAEFLGKVNNILSNFQSHHQPVKIYESSHLIRHSNLGKATLNLFNTSFNSLLNRLVRVYDVPFKNFNEFSKWLKTDPGVRKSLGLRKIKFENSNLLHPSKLYELEKEIIPLLEQLYENVKIISYNPANQTLTLEITYKGKTFQKDYPLNKLTKENVKKAIVNGGLKSKKSRLLKIDNIKAYSKGILDKSKFPGVEAHRLNNLTEFDNDVYDVPGLNFLLNLRDRTLTTKEVFNTDTNVVENIPVASSGSTNEAFKNLQEFLDWTHRVNIDAVQHPAIRQIVEFGKNFESKYLNTLNNVIKYSDDVLPTQISTSPVNMINGLLMQNPRFFRKADGSFDVNFYRHIRENLPSYEVKITNTDEFVSLNKEEFGFGLADFWTLTNVLDDAIKKLTKDAKNIRTIDNATLKDIIPKIYSDKNVIDVVGTKKDPTPLRKAIHYILDTNVADNVRQTRYAKLRGGNILLKDLNTFFGGNNYVTDSFTADVNIFTDIQSVLNKNKVINRQYISNTGGLKIKDQVSVEFENGVYPPPKKEGEDIVEEVKQPTTIPEAIVENVKKLPTEEFSKRVISSEPIQKYMYSALMSEEFPAYTEYASNIEELGKQISKYGTSKDVYFFDLLREAFAVPINNAHGEYMTFQLKEFQALDVKSKSLDKIYKVADREAFLKYNDVLIGDIVYAPDFVKSIPLSGGLQITILDPYRLEEIDRIFNALSYNISKIDPENRIFLAPFKKTLSDKRVAVGVALNYKNKDVVVEYLKLKDLGGLKDVIWEKPLDSIRPKLLQNEDYVKMDNFFKESEQLSKNLAIKLGHDNLTDGYIKHAINKNNPASAKYLSDVYTEIFEDSNAFDNLQEVANMIINNGRGFRKTFGTLPYDRHLRGGIHRYNTAKLKIFSTDFNEIIRSTFTKGMMDNANVQTYLSLFHNDNFRVKTYFKTTEDLRKVLFAIDPKTQKYSGNLTNMDIVSPVVDDTGRIVKFKKYDKLTDQGLQAALKDENAILIPNYIVAPLDRLLKTDAKMSNEIWAAFVKNVEVPFKFGVISNPGFLLGNISDAFLKQLVTMSKKYNTSIFQEILNTSYSMRLVTVLNNQFSDIYSKYYEFLIKQAGDKADKLIMYKNPAALTLSKKVKKKFIDFLNGPDVGNVLTKEEINKSRLYMYINNVQNTSVFDTDLKDNINKYNAESFNFKNETLEEAPNNKKPKYTVPQTFVEKILYGNKTKGTPGLMANNFYTDTILNQSGDIETLMRASTILNDLRHKGYTLEDIAKILGLEEGVEEAARKQLDIDMMDAINSMHEAQFNYKSVGDAVHVASYGIPFPTFFLKNFAYWIELWLTNPKLIEHMITIQNNLYTEEDMEDEFLAEAKGRGAIPIGQNMSSFFKGIYKPSPLNSMFGAFKLLNNPIQDISQRLNPALKLTTSPFMNNEDVKYRRYTTDQYERNIKKGDPEFNYLEYGMHAINPYERTINTYLRTPGKFAEGNAQLSDVFPSVFQPVYKKNGRNKKKKSRYY